MVVSTMKEWQKNVEVKKALSLKIRLWFNRAMGRSYYLGADLIGLILP